MTGVSQLVFADQANGSLITRDGKVVGSSLSARLRWLGLFPRTAIPGRRQRLRRGGFVRQQLRPDQRCIDRAHLQGCRSR